MKRTKEFIDLSGEWFDLFFASYLEMELAFTDCEEAGVDGKPGSLSDNGFSIADFDFVSFKFLQAEARSFCEEGLEFLQSCMSVDYGPVEAGEDFALTRNDFDSGFWVPELGKNGLRLAELALRYGETRFFYLDETKKLVV